VKAQTKRLLRYLDHEMSADEAAQFRCSLAASPELRRELAEMQQVGGLVRGWAATAEARAGQLLEPTLGRLRDAERRRARHTTLGYALAAALLVALPWSRHTPELAVPTLHTQAAQAPGAAIERIEAADQQAQVFVLGGSSTPVVWLADEAPDDDASEQQDPG
jgi:anti-sigma factor RsiW